MRILCTLFTLRTIKLATKGNKTKCSLFQLTLNENYASSICLRFRIYIPIDHFHCLISLEWFISYQFPFYYYYVFIICNSTVWLYFANYVGNFFRTMTIRLKFEYQLACVERTYMILNILSIKFPLIFRGERLQPPRF